MNTMASMINADTISMPYDMNTTISLSRTYASAALCVPLMSAAPIQ